MSRYLEMVDSPTHVKKLTLALHRVFETPKDKFLWDVSHQIYVHKLLTGRKNRFETIRSTGGLSGFALRSESEHDCYGAAHAGTALSAALGICAARDQRGSDENVVAISTYLNKLITHPSYNKLAREFESFVRRLPKGELALKLAHKAEEGFKGAITGVGLQQAGNPADADGRGGYGSPVLFEEMGVRYLGPIDGHDLPLLISTLEFAKTCDHPIVIHILTKKGKGFEAALKYPEKFHGLGPYDVITGETPIAKPGTPPNYQDVMGQTLVKLCQKDN